MNMNMMQSSRENDDVTRITMVERKGGSDEKKEKRKGVRWAVPVSLNSRKTKEEGSGSDPIASTTRRWKKGLAITDFVLRLGAIGLQWVVLLLWEPMKKSFLFSLSSYNFTLSGTASPCSSRFFVVANGVISGYCILILPFSYVCIVRPHSVGPRLLLITCDIVMAGLITAGASAAAATVYLAHNGSQEANWMAFCQGFSNFCQTASEAVVISYVAVVFFLCLIMLSALALKRN